MLGSDYYTWTVCMLDFLTCSMEDYVSNEFMEGIPFVSQESEGASSRSPIALE